VKAWAKQRIQQYLRTRGLKITHDREDSWLPDFDLLQLIVESAGPGVESIRTILQVGANDGAGEDPIASMIEASAARAWLIEPLPGPFARLETRYRDHDRVILINAALGPEDGEATIWRVAPDTDELAGLSVLATFDRSVLEKFRPMFAPQGGRIVGETVRTISVPTLLKEQQLDEIDLLQVDTEGWDAKVVGWFLDAGRLPGVINFEHVHLRGAEDRALIQRLRGEGYDLARYGRDTTCVRRSEEPLPEVVVTATDAAVSRG
jgi:FkbM family methyltransferase